ncbi:hypothetical protein GGX14DRAFT_405688 [Mycena pura]|uniref:Uncharacterized protein n=1 Tax=Mycena pura TaxID=153505 RepID=A0AAD6UV17_9AGAR|nr:hypothetical protein GGX14DRAFT_405688 [Mycena pura]
MPSAGTQSVERRPIESHHWQVALVLTALKEYTALAHPHKWKLCPSCATTNREDEDAHQEKPDSLNGCDCRLQWCWDTSTPPERHHPALKQHVVGACVFRAVHHARVRYNLGASLTSEPREASRAQGLKLEAWGWLADSYKDVYCIKRGANRGMST